ncbi:hypothetical protein BLOT_001988 [Blomia tropicalis]|nr:hypothetical protein BLOT_001988 [Blomia tropicalis]
MSDPNESKRSVLVGMITSQDSTASHGIPILDKWVKDKYSDVSCNLKRKVQTNDCNESIETCSSFENDNSPIDLSQTGSNNMQENILYPSPTANVKSNETVAGKKNLKVNNDKKQFNCEFCQLSVDQQDDLINHLLIHQNEVEVDSKNELCCYCQIPFKNMTLKEIGNHIHSHISPTSTARLSKKRELTCEHCSEKIQDLNHHILKSIKVCSVCGIDIRCSSMMKLHQHNLHRSVFISRKFEMSDSENFYLCLSCMEHIPNLNSLINHSLDKDHIGFNHSFNVEH